MIKGYHRNRKQLFFHLEDVSHSTELVEIGPANMKACEWLATVNVFNRHVKLQLIIQSDILTLGPRDPAGPSGPRSPGLPWITVRK